MVDTPAAKARGNKLLRGRVAAQGFTMIVVVYSLYAAGMLFYFVVNSIFYLTTMYLQVALLMPLKHLLLQEHWNNYLYNWMFCNY